jgi:hypothetical protein
MQKNQARGSGEISQHRARGLPNPIIAFSNWHRNFTEVRAEAKGIEKTKRNFRQLGAEWAAETRRARGEGGNAYREFFFWSMAPVGHGIPGVDRKFNYGAAERRAESRFLRSIIEHLDSEGITGAVEVNSFIHGASRNFGKEYRRGFNEAREETFWERERQV